MKFKQYITESGELSVQEVLEQIYTDCKPYLKDLVRGGFDYYRKNDNLLYSGRNTRADMFKKSVRTDRKPKDTSEDVQKFVDEAFKKKFGVKARSSSLFATGRVDTAQGYGNSVYTIFPIGKYKVIWSPNIMDLYNDVSDWDIPRVQLQREEAHIAMRYMKTDPKVGKVKYDEAYEIYLRGMRHIATDVVQEYKEGDVVKAISRGNEIMLVTKQVLGYRWDKWDKVIKSYIDKYGGNYPTTKNLLQWSEHYGSSIPGSYKHQLLKG
jgi:hypothetical protein